MAISFETKNILIAVQRNIVAKCKLTFRHIELFQEVLVAKRTQGLLLSTVSAFYWKSDIVEIFKGICRTSEQPPQDLVEICHSIFWSNSSRTTALERNRKYNVCTVILEFLTAHVNQVHVSSVQSLFWILSDTCCHVLITGDTHVSCKIAEALPFS